MTKKHSFISPGPETCSKCGKHIGTEEHYLDGGRFNFCLRCLGWLFYELKLRPQWDKEHGGSMQAGVKET